MALISMAPTEAMSATDEPDTPEKITEEMTFTWPSPPGSQPTIASAKSKMRSATLPRSMTAPTRMNSGTATSRNEFIDENMVCVRRSNGIGVNRRSVTTPASPSATASGTPTMLMAKKTISRKRLMLMAAPPRSC